MLDCAQYGHQDTGLGNSTLHLAQKESRSLSLSLSDGWRSSLPSWPLAGFLYVSFLPVFCKSHDHLLYVENLCLLHSCLLHFSYRTWKTQLWHRVYSISFPQFKKNTHTHTHHPTWTEHAMLQSGPSGFFSESKTCVFLHQGFLPTPGVSSILLWLSLRRRGLQTTNQQKGALFFHLLGESQIEFIWR